MLDFEALSFGFAANGTVCVSVAVRGSCCQSEHDELAV